MVKSLLKSGALSNSFEAYAVCTLQDCKDLFSSKACSLYCTSRADASNTYSFARSITATQSSVRTNLRITK
jgi:hypothetical protein